MIDILQEIEIASIGAVVGITGVILLACITRCLYELITWKCLRYKILKRDIVDLLKPTAFIIAFVVIYLITRYLGLHPLYFYGLFFGVFIVGIASLAKNLAKSRKKDQTYYYTFELIFFICLMVGLLVELIF